MAALEVACGLRGEGTPATMTRAGSGGQGYREQLVLRRQCTPFETDKGRQRSMGLVEAGWALDAKCEAEEQRSMC